MLPLANEVFNVNKHDKLKVHLFKSGKISLCTGTNLGVSSSCKARYVTTVLDPIVIKSSLLRSRLSGCQTRKIWRSIA